MLKRGVANERYTADLHRSGIVFRQTYRQNNSVTKHLKIINSKKCHDLFAKLIFFYSHFYWERMLPI